MKYPKQIFLTALAVMLAATQASSAQEKEKSVAFRTSDKKFITTGTSGSLELSGTKVGSKQIFTIIDINGGELADGDEVKIRYTPNSPTGPDLTKANYWRETKDGLKRGREGSIFKLKKVDANYAFQSPAGKFVAMLAGQDQLGFVDAQEGALQVEIIDAAPAPKKSEQAPAEKPSTE